METTKECDSIEVYKYKILEFVKGKTDDIDIKIVEHLYSCSECRSNYAESRALFEDGKRSTFYGLRVFESQIIHFDGDYNSLIAKSLWSCDFGSTYKEMEEENNRSYQRMLTRVSGSSHNPLEMEENKRSYELEDIPNGEVISIYKKDMPAASGTGLTIPVDLLQSYGLPKIVCKNKGTGCVLHIVGNIPMKIDMIFIEDGEEIYRTLVSEDFMESPIPIEVIKNWTCIKIIRKK